jgi:hypothetical protein
LHPSGQRGRRRLLQPGGVDHPEAEIGDPALAFAAIAGHPGCIVDESESPADEPIEQC